MSDARKTLILQWLLGVGLALGMFWSSANNGWMNPVINLPGVARISFGATLLWMLVAVLLGGALTDRKNFIYVVGLATVIPTVFVLMMEPFI